MTYANEHLCDISNFTETQTETTKEYKTPNYNN